MLTGHGLEFLEIYGTHLSRQKISTDATASIMEMDMSSLNVTRALQKYSETLINSFVSKKY